MCIIIFTIIKLRILISANYWHYVFYLPVVKKICAPKVIENTISKFITAIADIFRQQFTIKLA